MKNFKSKAVFVSALASTFASQAAAQTTFSHDNTIAITAVGGGEDLLTEGASGPPVVAIGGSSLGLVPGDHIDALSFGNDTPLMTEHQIVFSVDANSIGLGFVGNNVAFEFNTDSAPCAGAVPVPAAACGDIFIQTPGGGSHVLAPSGSGYSPGGVAAGDECYAKWAGGNFPPPGTADDLNAFDYTAPADAAGIYFSLAPGSPTLAAIAATPGDILYSDLSGAAPVIATLGGGAGLATAANLGIAAVGVDLDALSLVGTTGPVGGGGGVITAGAVGPAPANTGVVSTHVLEFSITRGGGAVGFAADVLVRVGAGVAAVFVRAEEGLGLAIVDEDELNALEVIPMPIVPTISEWGLAVMTLLLLAGGTLVLRRLPLAGRHGRRAMYSNPVDKTFLAALAVGASLAATGSATADEIIPVAQNRWVRNENVNAPQCSNDFLLEEDVAAGFEPFDAFVATEHDCDSGYARASAGQQSQIGPASMAGAGNATSDGSGPVAGLVHAFGVSFFEVTFDVPSAADVDLTGVITAGAAPDPSVGALARIKLTGPGGVLIVEYTVQPASGGGTSSQVIDEDVSLGQGQYIL